MNLKLTSVLALVSLISSSAFAGAQSYMDLGFLVPPGFFALGIEGNQSWNKVTTGALTEPSIDVRDVRQETRGFLRFGLFNDLEIKISGAQGKNEETLTKTYLVTNGTDSDTVTNSSGMVNPEIEMNLRLIGNGESIFNFLVGVGYAPSTGDRKFAVTGHDGNMKAGATQMMGSLGMNLKFENSDWLLSGQYVKQSAGQGSDADDANTVDLGAFTATTIKLNYRLNFWHVLYIDLFAGKSKTSDIVNTDQTTLEETTTSFSGDNFYGAGLGLLISGQVKLEAQAQTSALKEKITVKDNSGSIDFDTLEDRKVNLSLSFVM